MKIISQTECRKSRITINKLLMSDLEKTAILWSAHLLNQGVSYDFSVRDVKAMRLMEKFLKLSEHPNHHPKHKDSLDDFNGYIDNRCIDD